MHAPPRGRLTRPGTLWLLAAALLPVLPWTALPAPATPPATVDAGEAPFPDARWPHGQRPGWDAAALEALFDFAAGQGSTGVVMVHGGRLMAERYWPAPSRPRFDAMVARTTADGRTVEDVASVQKSLVGFLVGMAQERGLLSIRDPVSRHLGEGWSRAGAGEEEKIRIRHLLAMTSGLAPDLTLEAPPGTTWRYNTRAYSKLVAALEAASGRTIQELTREWLTGPLGMSETGWRERPWVTPRMDANPLGLVSSARDLARFGLLMLRQGRWRDRQLLQEEGYLTDATRPSQPFNPAYGYLWWLNGAPMTVPGASEPIESLAPAAPPDLYAAQGALGRKLYVVPSLDLVVVRLGDQPQAAFNHTFWRLLMAVLPQQHYAWRAPSPGAPRPGRDL